MERGEETEERLQGSVHELEAQLDAAVSVGMSQEEEAKALAMRVEEQCIQMTTDSGQTTWGYDLNF